MSARRAWAQKHCRQKIYRNVLLIGGVYLELSVQENNGNIHRNRDHGRGM